MSIIIKMDSIKDVGHLNAAIVYIMNEAKTKGLTYSNSGTIPSEIIDTFKFTRENVKNVGKRVGYHFKYSFSKDETIDDRKAYAFIKDWVDEYLKDKYHFVCAVHSDREHMHMHLVFNSICRDGGKYRYKQGDWDRVIKPLTNKLADKYNTGHLKERDKGIDYNNELEQNHKWQDIIREDIDKCILISADYEDFKSKMISEFKYNLREGVSRNHGIYLSLTPPGKSKAIRSYQLGNDYMPGKIDERIRLKENGILENLNRDRYYREIYNVRNIWFLSKPIVFIPYEELSIYQKYFVRKMLDARRLYSGTNSTLLMKDRALSAMKGITDDALFLCRLNIKSKQELERTIKELEADKMVKKNKVKNNQKEKIESKNLVLKKLKEIESTVFSKRKERKY